MKIFAIAIAIYAPLMFLLHVSTGKILCTWKDEPESWISRWCTARRILRVEALFWLIALASWSLWPSLGAKLLVAIFAVVHLVIWFVNEFTGSREAAFIPEAAILRAIVAFDLTEAVVLAGAGVVAILYLAKIR